MTSKLTRERLAELVAFKPLPGTDINSATLDEWMAMAAELQERRKAAMDSDPVYQYQSGVYNDYNGETDWYWDDCDKGFYEQYAHDRRRILYRHAQPAPVVPEVLPCPVLLEPGLRFGKGIKTRTVLAALARREVYESDMAVLSFEEKAELQSKITDFKALLSKQTSVSPDFDTWFNGPDAGLRVVNYHIQRELQESAWNACHAAMLRAQSDDDGEPTDDERIMAIEGIHNCERCGDEVLVADEMSITRYTCKSDKSVFKIDHNSDFIKHVKTVSGRVRAGNSPVIQDGSAVAAITGIPIIPDGYVMVPKVVTPEISNAINEVGHRCTCGNCSQRLWDLLLAATPHLPGSDTITVPGRWVPVSERIPETDGNYWGWWSESKRQGPVWFIKSELQAQFQSHEITHWMPLPSAPQERKP